jgi:DNA polymerase-3 subunit epsilon
VRPLRLPPADGTFVAIDFETADYEADSACAVGLVRYAPQFAEIWPRLAPLLDGAHALVAHNASFDRKVLHTCCTAARLAIPEQPFVCTVHISRKKWKQRPNNLPSVCARLGIALKHHDAGSDAEACARILIAAYEPVAVESVNTLF